MAVSPTSTLAGLSLRDLQYAATVDQTRHFGQAAERCGVSQAALSEQLRKLEDLLGARLFERGHRKVEPTERGRVLLRQIDRVLAEAQDLLAMSRDVPEPLTGLLRLGAIATLGPYYLPHLLRQSRAAFPRMVLQLNEGQTAGLLDALRRSMLDAVLMALPAGVDGAASETLFFEPFRLVCPAEHALAALPRLTLPDLAGADLILLEEGHCLRDHALRLCSTTAAAGRHATSVETLWHMIAAGEGYSLLPALSTVGRETMDRLVACRDIDDAEAGRSIGLVWRSTDPRGEDFRTLAGFLRANAPAGVMLNEAHSNQ
jgi:LysR family hydrogen peroxide-inducible transcriptional activator